MIVIYDPEFVKQFRKLPGSIQKMFKKQEFALKENPRDSKLHIKKLHGYKNTFSIRVTRSYRALFVLVKPSTVIFSDIGHRKDIYE